MSVDTKKSIGGKYRDIIIAASLFVLFDLAVLVLNFYTSFQISQDAVAINLAGRQRMLSQRMTKSLLQVQSGAATQSMAASRDELASTYQLFDTTLYAFMNGGQARNTDDTMVELHLVDDAEARTVLSGAASLWEPIKKNINGYLANPDDSDVLATSVLLATQKNVELLKLMNQLTTRLAVLAQEKAERLRWFQVIGISFALVNFAFLLFHFIKKLRRGDEAIAVAEGETQEILGTVNEGFFLIDEDLNLGYKYSDAMTKILKRDVIPGTPFMSLLQGKVSDTTLDTAREYLNLLFTRRIRESLAADLNPLLKLEIDLGTGSGGQSLHYLDITFKRVHSGDRITHLLGTIVDVTAQVKLEASLAHAEKRSQEEIEMLSNLLQSNPAHIKDFLDNTRTLLLSINNRFELSKGGKDVMQIVMAGLPDIHKAKGDASVLGNDIFVTLLHELEQRLKAVRDNTTLTSQDILPVTVQINEILAKFSAVSTIIDKLSKLLPGVSQSTRITRAQSWLDDFNRLTGAICAAVGKRATLAREHSQLDMLGEDHAKALREICVQMIRNAIMHGLESPAERMACGKEPGGHIKIAVTCSVGKTDLVIRDDGRGLSPANIRNALLTNGKYSAAEVEAMDDRTVVMSIFKDGLSTADALSKHAGQGVGMTIVRQTLKRLQGRIGITTRAGRFTEFRMSFTGIDTINNADCDLQREVLVA